MSTPRVGSSSTSTSGRFTIAAAMATFCWLPPDSERIGMSSDARLDPELVAQLVGDRAHPPAPQRAAAAP